MRLHVLSVLLVLLMVLPAASPPLLALSQAADGQDSYSVNSRLLESVSKAMAGDPLLRAAGALAEAMDSGDSRLILYSSGESSSKPIPALVVSGIDDSSKMISLSEAKVFFKANGRDYENPDDLLGKWFTLYWYTGGNDNRDSSPVVYDPGNPSGAAFGGYLDHRVTISVKRGEFNYDIDEDAGNVDEIAEMFKEGVSFSVKVIRYDRQGNYLKASIVEKDDIKGVLPDYNVYYVLEVEVEYKPELLEKASQLSGDKGDGYAYFVQLDVSFTVTVKNTGATKEVASFSTREMDEVDYSSLVAQAYREALDRLASSISSSGLPHNVKSKFLQAIDSWRSEVSRIVFKTRHNFEIRFFFTVTSEHTLYTYHNGSLEDIDYWTQTDIADTVVGPYVDRTEEVEQGALERADNELVKHYPYGLKTFMYDTAWSEAARVMVDNQKYVLDNGVPSPVARATNTSLLFTLYPSKVGSAKLTDVDIRRELGDTGDYTYSGPRVLRESAGYSDSWSSGEYSYEHRATYRLKFWIDIHVWESTVRVNLVPHDVEVAVAINPTIVAKKAVDLEDNGTSRLIPALAPLGGSGVPTMILGGASQLGLDTLNRIIEAADGFAQERGLVQMVLPTYFPVPMPHDSIKIFAPGEYIGAYYMVKGMKFSNLLLERLPKPAFSFSVMYENVTFSLAKSDGSKDGVAIVKVTNSRIERIAKNSFSMYSLGFGVGDIWGKAIGSRLYIAPSSAVIPSLKSSGDAQDKPEGEGIGDGNPLGGIFSLPFFGGGNDGEDGIVDKLLKHTPIGKLLETLKEIGDQALNYGIYPQVTPYLTTVNKNKDGKERYTYLWPYILVTTKNTYRFVATEPGDYTLKAEAFFAMVNVMVYKTPFIGIPLPLPVLVFKKDSIEDNSIKVRSIGALPLLVDYHIEKPDRVYTLDDTLGDSYVSIYAVPVWLDLDGRPMSPVLFRGRYGPEGNGTSLALAVYTNTTVELRELVSDLPDDKMAEMKLTDYTVLDMVDVYFFGMPLKPLKIPLKALDRIAGDDNETVLYLKPAWKHGRSIDIGGAGGVALELRVARVKSFPLLHLDGDRVLVYTGVYDPDNRIHEELSRIAEKAEEVLGGISENIREVKSSLEDVNSKLQSLIGETGSSLDEELASTFDSIQSVTREFAKSIADIIWRTAQGIATQLIASAVASAIVAIVVPDPTGLIVGAIRSAIEDVISNVIGSMVDDIMGEAKDFANILMEYGYQAVKAVALELARELIFRSGLDEVIAETSEFITKVVDVLDRIDNSIQYILSVIDRAVQLSVYKPLLLGTVYVYDTSGRPVSASGLLGSGRVLPFDILTVGSSSTGFMMAAPDSVIGEAIGIVQNLLGKEDAAGPGDYNIEVVLPGIAAYSAAWLSFLSEILENKPSASEKLNNIAGKLYSFSERMNNIITGVQEWVEVPGIEPSSSLTIMLPSASLLPPSRI